MNENAKLGFLFILVPILGWGIAPIIVGQGLKYIDALPFLFLRFLTALLLILPYVLLFKRTELKKLLTNKWTWYTGLAQTWAMTFQYLSQIYISPSLSATIAYSYLILVPVISVFFLRSPFNKLQFANVFVALFGLLLITFSVNGTNFTLSLLGILLALSATFGFAFYIVLTSRLILMEVYNVDSIALFAIVIAIVSISAFVLTQVFHSNINPLSYGKKSWEYIVLLAIISTILAYIAYNQSLKYLSANVASVLLLLQIIIPYIIELVLYSKTYSVFVYIGACIILFSSYFVVRLSDS